MIFKAMDRDQLINLPEFKELNLAKVFEENPLHFIDIGARGGTHDLVVPMAANTSVLGFEPDAPECERLKTIKEVVEPWAEFNLEPIGLYNSKGTQKLYLLEADTNHSLLPSNDVFVKRYNMKKFEVVGDIDVETEKLDTIYNEKYTAYNNFGEFMKVDTQGTECEILEGATEILNKNTVAVVSEVSFFEIYKGQKLFSDVEKFMRAQGFAFFGFSSKLHTRSCKLVEKTHEVTRERAMYADAVFFRDPLAGGENTQRQNQSLFVCTLLLGYFDYAAELAIKVLYPNDKVEQDKCLKLIKSLAYKPAEDTRADVIKLKENIDKTPDKANIYVGSFVDERRDLCNYDDVLAVSPLPTTY